MKGTKEMSLSEKIYSHSPIWGQNILTTLRGWQLRRLRYTQHTQKVFEFLMASQSWTLAQFEKYQCEQLRLLVQHAMQYSPYYRQRYTELKIDPATLGTLVDLQSLPIIGKEEFRRNNDQFVSTHIERKQMWVAHTSGTTGTPLTAFHTYPSVQERVAFMERLYHWYTPKRWPKRASFTGKLMVDPEQSKSPFHRTNLALNQQLYSSHHLIEQNLDRYVEELSRFAPDQIDGIASTIHVVANHLLRTGRVGTVLPNVVIPTSETLWPFVREQMEQAFLCKVANQYGSQEGAPLAYECPEGGFHICPESGIFEILNSNAEPCPPGETGRLVVTSFLSQGMPLIRYDIGDLASWREGTCSCGRKMPLLQTIEGRVDDMFFTRERGVVSRVDSAFKSLPSSIIATQVAQISLDQFEVRIVPDLALYKPEQGEMLKEHLHDYLGKSVRIEVIIVPSLKRTPGGKMPVMVNECKDVMVKDAIIQKWNQANSYGW